MKRAEIIELCGVSRDFFASLAKRGQFPFLGRPEGRAEAFGRYPAAVAFKTVLALALNDAGATQEEAGHFVEVEYRELFAISGGSDEIEEGNVYFGYALLDVGERDPEVTRYERAALRYPLYGSRKAIGKVLDRLETRKSGQRLLAVVQVNASEHLRLLKARAEHLGVELPSMAPAHDGEAA